MSAYAQSEGTGARSERSMSAAKERGADKEREKKSEAAGDASGADDELPVEKKKITANFSVYADDLRALCKAIDGDGRRDELQRVLTAGSARDPACSSCKPFISAFAAACKSKNKVVPPVMLKKKVSEDEGDASEDQEEAPATPTPTPEPRARLPRLEVVNQVVSLFGRIRDDATGRNMEDVYPAIAKTLKLLKDPTGKPQGVYEYLSTLAVYIQAPFAEYEAELERERSREERREARRKARGQGFGGNVDDLFQ